MILFVRFLLVSPLCLKFCTETEGKQSKSINKEKTDWKFFEKFAETDKSRLDLVAQKEGFPAEQHKLTTEDGFRLTLTRILPKLNGTVGKGEPVILVHGMTCNAALWLALPPSYNLAYLLASAGYDVWLFNSRGKFKSDGHVTFKNNGPEIWNWTLHEVGYHDVPATIDYVLNTTAQEQTSVVAVSLGADFIFIALTERPEYNKKVRRVITLGPGFPTRSQIGFAWNTFKVVERSISKWNLHQLGNRDLFGGKDCLKMLYWNCSAKAERRGCPTLVARDMGMAPYNEESREHAVAMYRYRCLNVCTMAMKMVFHGAQRIGNKNAQYSFGSDTNLQLYNSMDSPKYDIKKLSTPLYIFYAKADKVILLKELEAFCKKLFKNGQEVHCIKIKEPRFGHGDFILNVDAKKYVHDEILHILKEDKKPKLFTQTV